MDQNVTQCETEIDTSRSVVYYLTSSELTRRPHGKDRMQRGESRMKLSERVAIVTGGGSGIGQATAHLFAEEGATVVVVDWHKDAGEATARAIRDSGLKADFCYADVSKPADVEAMVATTVDKHGRLDILFNNAAVQILSKLVETTEDAWDRIHSVNLKGVFLCCKYAVPKIIASGGGSIINMASVLGFVGDPDLAAYCAAKGGVIALTKAASLTYGPEGVRVNCICPGDVETPLLRDYFDKDPDPQKLRNEISSKYALRRVAAPKEIAKVAVFLASGDSSFITGGMLVVDGGLTIKCY
jgi:meso-butanediol dehydrogenase/(S,S)-butanediol dehydrogenase/diacetyl reductase